jgi:hypothetical protein
VTYTYNIQNTTQLITDLKTIKISKHTRICSFYIENIYTNIPRTETTDIVTSIPKINSGYNENSPKEVIHILKSVMEQNYFQFEQTLQTDGLAMGSTASAIIAEAYIQNM